MKNLRITTLLLLTALSGFSLSAQGAGGTTGWEFNPAFMYLIESTTSGGATTTSNRLLGDLGLGYKFSSPIFAGALYGYDSTSVSSPSGSSKATFTSYGPSFGIEADNVYMIFTYFIYSQYEISSGSSTTTYSSGNGYQLAFGYRFNMGSSWSVGPQLSYRSLHYTQSRTGSGATGSADYTYTSLLPYVALNFNF